MDRSTVITDSGVTALDVLRMIARGHSYSQILEAYPALVMSDITRAVQACIDILEKRLPADGMVDADRSIGATADGGQPISIEQLRRRYPRAYERWEQTEQDRLVALFEKGKPFNEIADSLGRNVGAVVSRLKRIGLIT
jgi:DNA-binding CsgD family transcriptional regulator